MRKFPRLDSIQKNMLRRMSITHTKSEMILSSFFEQCGASKISWNTQGFGIFHLVNKRGAVELETITLKVYLYYDTKTMEIFNGCLADPDSLDKLRAILVDRKREITHELESTELSCPAIHQ